MKTCIHKTLCVGLTAIGLLAIAAQAHAADDKAEKTANIPLNKVVLFSSGVGFFEHNGQVEGNAKIDLKFNIQDINDLLKSMVLQDADGGKISTITYGSRDPVTKALKTFAIDLTANPTLADLLKQIRGEKVLIEAPTAISGTIVSVDKRKVRVGKDETIDVDILVLLTADGLRSVSLEQVNKIKLVDEKLNAELHQALGIMAMGHSTDKKTVSLSFLGAGKRNVSVGYIQESPIWKTSYRLVLKDDGQPLLQGWAIVENSTEQDWNNVDLTLISGRPISFIMDLYQPLYAQRPVVVPEMYASLRPQTYDQDMAAKDGEFLRKADAGKDANGLAMQRRAGAGGGFGGGAPGAAAPAAKGASRAEYDRAGEDKAGGANRAFDPSAGVASIAQTDKVGELFKYAIGTPVTLPRQQSAMLPIVNESVKGEKVSIYNPSVQPKHPLNGLKLINSTDLHLMQGPITVFDGGAYAGDAKIDDLPPKSERLISYALDLDTEVAPESKNHPDQIVTVKIAKGTLHVTRKYTRTQKYVVKNGSKKAKKVLIEYPYDASWTLTAPKEPAEKTRGLYRFAVTAEPGKPATLEVDEEQAQNQQFGLTNIDDGTIRIYINAKVTSAEVKKALEEVIRRKVAIGQVVEKRNQLQGQIQAIDQEQSRIRQNMAQLDKTNDVYLRYVKKFGEQEDTIENLRKQITTLQDDESKQRKSLDEFLLGLDLS